MSDLAKSQADWNRFFEEEFCTQLAMLRDIRELRDKFRYERTQCYILDGRSYVTAVVLTGVDFGINTTSTGLLYVRLTANGGNWDVHIYKATGAGGGDEVASVTALAASATGTLVAQNSSGIGGTITLGGSPAAVAADTLQLFPVVDYRQRWRKILDGTYEKDSSTMALMVSACEAVEQLLEQARGTILAAIDSWGTALGQSGPEFFGSSFADLLSDTPVQDPSGAISRRRSGMLVALKEAMADDTVAGEQDVVRRVAAAGAGSFDAGNTGLGAVASHTPGEQCPVGRWEFECEAGADTGDGGSERFRGRVKIDGTDEELVFGGLVVEQQWSGPRGFGPITLTRTKTKTNDGSNNVFAAASGATVTGANRANTDNGTLHVSVAANGGNWDISFFKSSNRTAGDLMAKATNIAASAAFVATPKNGSNLTVSWTLGGTVSAIITITLLLNFFVTENADGVSDKFVILTSVTGTPGLIQETVAEELGYALNSDTSGSESFADGHMKAGTFPPLAVQDN